MGLRGSPWGGPAFRTLPPPPAGVRSPGRAQTPSLPVDSLAPGSRGGRRQAPPPVQWVTVCPLAGTLLPRGQEAAMSRGAFLRGNRSHTTPIPGGDPADQSRPGCPLLPGDPARSAKRPPRGALAESSEGHSTVLWGRLLRATWTSREHGPRGPAPLAARWVPGAGGRSRAAPSGGEHPAPTGGGPAAVPWAGRADPPPGHMSVLAWPRGRPCPDRSSPRVHRPREAGGPPARHRGVGVRVCCRQAGRSATGPR